MASMTRKGQVYSVGNYLMTGKVFGKGHFARVEEATHRIIGRKVAIKIIDLTLIKEEYARRNLHREPRVMAKLKHPCIAALYETMMHGPRLYVVMEAAGGGDLCAHVLAHGARGRPAHAPHGLPEPRARSLAAQLVSAVRHMHARGVVHRDLKMENIMLDTTKQFIKIVDFGLSNMWSGGAALRTPCGSLEYAAPELFVDGRRYGPEVDLWSVGVIVYGMVLGSLPFTGGEREAGGERAQLRAAIARGLTRRQRAALQVTSPDCKAFIQQLLEPNVELRMKIEEAARHRWVKRPGMKMKVHPLPALEPKVTRDVFKQIAELTGQPVIEVVSQVKAEPFGAMAGMYNIKSHLHQMQAAAGADLLWSAGAVEPRPDSPPHYAPPHDSPCSSKHLLGAARKPPPAAPRLAAAPPRTPPARPLHAPHTPHAPHAPHAPHTPALERAKPTPQPLPHSVHSAHSTHPAHPTHPSHVAHPTHPSHLSQPRFTQTLGGGRKYRMYENGDCLDARLPCIDEHEHADFSDAKRQARIRNPRSPRVRRAALEPEPLRLHSCPARAADFYRRAGDAVPSWRGVGAAPAPRILLQNHATTIKRASLGNIVSPHSSSNSHCKSERAMPVGWFPTKPSVVKEPTHFQRLRRTAPMK